jgi:periplasmic copper chaperone A
MNRRLVVSTLMILGFFAVAGLSGCAPTKALSVSNVRSNACKAGDACGVFMTISNPAAVDDVVLGAKVEVAERAELHTVVKDAQGGMKMTPVENIPVPAAGTVELKPGSLHVMLFNLNKDLKKDDTFPLTLKCQKAGDVTVQVKVQSAN